MLIDAPFQDTVKPERIADSAFALECTLQHAVPIGDGEYTMMLLVGQIQRVHVRADVLAPGGKTIDSVKHAPVTRLGSKAGNIYARLGEVYNIPNPAWNEENQAAITQKKSHF